MTRTFALTSHKRSELTPNPIPPPSTCLHGTHAFVHVKEYARVIHALNTLATSSNETMGVLRLLHPLVEVDLPFFVDDFHPEAEVTLDWQTFVFALVCSLHLSSDGPWSMVYELL
jgi:hypothetical protein